MNHHIVLRVVAKLLIPSILLFALYTQFHGDYGPGGGFQAGVIYTAAFILHTLIFGLENTKKIISPELVQVLSAVGVILYAAVGFVSIFLGGNFLTKTNIPFSVCSSLQTRSLDSSLCANSTNFDLN